ncbi:glycosyltransferase family 4 protein [Negadavirga shengliensis]|uniref:Glycosyltransferase family 4 protein n=1 Tax=Negadavirga shengliensis TaxID=1389218 RepID=A0ABV9T528_9BACT
MNGGLTKLILIQDTLANAGAEKSHLEIFSRLAVDIEMVLVYFYPNHDLMEAYQQAGIRTVFFDIRKKYGLFLGARRLIRLIRKEKPDLLISCLWRSDIIARMASFWTGVPLVGTLVNDSYGEYAWKEKKGLKHKLVFWLDRATAFIPVYWIANARSLAESHINTLGIVREKVSVVYRGRSVKNVICQHPSQIRNFISYGRLLERKGFGDLIRAFDQVLRTQPDCTLTIYGEGPFKTELEELIWKLGLEEKVSLPGAFGPTRYPWSVSPQANPILLPTNLPWSVSSQTKYMSSQTNKQTTLPLPWSVCPQTNPQTNPASSQANKQTTPLTNPTAHCFLFPSWYEGFSGALVEAMMAGIPIIASDIPMNLEAVTQGKNALVFPVKNVEALARQMIYAIEHPEEMARMGQNAQEEAVRRFDIRKIARKYEEVLKDVYHKTTRLT